MPARHLVAKELGHLFAVFTHPDRIRIVEELGEGERDVNALQAALNVTHSRTSQNLAILRAHRVVTERREGRHVFYRLVEPDIARWVLDGLRFIEADIDRVRERQHAIDEARQLWQVERAPGESS